MDEGEEQSTPISASEPDFDVSQSEPQPEPTSGANSNQPRRRISGSRRYHGPSEDQQYAAATKLANNPNTPEFFSDAVMANSQAPKPRKNHRGLIIIVAAAVILFVGSLTAWLLLNPNSPIVKKEGTKSVRIFFNEFANYLLYGRDDDSSDITAEYELYNFYYHSDPNNKDLKGYFGKSKEKYAKFYNAYLANKQNDDKYRAALGQYYDNLDLLHYVEGKTIYNSWSLLSSYRNDMSHINSVINDFPVPGKEYSQSTIEIINNYRSLLTEAVDILTTLNDADCINHETGTLLDSCQYSSESPYSNQIERLSLINTELTSIYNKQHSAFLQLYGSVWTIKEIVYTSKETANEKNN